MKRALVVGCDGQDGRLLHENLSRKAYAVTGVGRRTLDITDRQAVLDLVGGVSPDEIYYLPAVHHSSENLTEADDAGLFRESFAVHVSALIHFLDAMRRAAPRSRLFYAASSHVFGDDAPAPQDESTPFDPSGIYGITKAAGVQSCRYYRARHGLFVSTGILYNHESPLRAPSFVSKKIVNAAIRIRDHEQETLRLGALAAEVDWGYAPDFVEAFHRILGLDRADDFVIATGEKHSVGEFVEIAFSRLGLDWKNFVEEDNNLLRKTVTTRIGNPEKLMRATGWRPSVSFARMVELLLGEGTQQRD
jgi:GDPmannose 4,6-dehydratase